MRKQLISTQKRNFHNSGKPCERVGIVRDEFISYKAVETDSGDHGGVICAVFGRSDTHFDSFGSLFCDKLSQELVACDSSGEDNLFYVEVLRGEHGLAGESIDDRHLIGGDSIIKQGVFDIFDSAEPLGVVEQRGFDSAEAEVVTVLWGEGFACASGEGARKIVGFGISVFRDFGDDGTSGISEIEQFAAFVESLSGGIVDGASELPGGSVLADENEGGVAS
jgi:hypothetical protein